MSYFFSDGHATVYVFFPGNDVHDLEIRNVCVQIEVNNGQPNIKTVEVYNGLFNTKTDISSLDEQKRNLVRELAKELVDAAKRAF
jgi:hypothetical protein